MQELTKYWQLEGESDDVAGNNREWSLEVKQLSKDIIEDVVKVENVLEEVKKYDDLYNNLLELLQDGDYLGELLAYEKRILEYYNKAYNTNEEEVTDGILDNLSALEMEELTAPLINKIIYQEHKTQALEYYNLFRSDKNRINKS